MADDIFINGLGPGVPEWSNEATQKQVLNALNSGLSQNTAANRQILSMLKRIANGEKVQQGQLRGALKELSKQTKVTSQNARANQQASRNESKQLSIFGQLARLSTQQLQMQRQQLDVAKRTQELQKEGFSGGFAKMQAELEKKQEDVSFVADMFKKAATVFTGTVTAIAALNNFVETGARERFSFAQELRQSGLTAGLDSASSSLTALSKATNFHNFTLGEAAEFTRNFSQAVGVRGVEASLEFANNLASESGGDFMQRFGLQFGEVTDLAGTYLESLRNIGALDKISRADMDRGMENFMSTVVSTSNIMKINLQESAELIKNTLQRDDVSSLLATLPDAVRQNAEAVVGMAGGMNSSLGEALAMRLAAGSNQGFVQTEQFAALMSDPITAGLLPIVEQLATATETGGTGAFQQTLANLGPQLESIVAGANRSLLLTGTGDSQRTIADVMRLLQTLGDADAGRAPLAADDRTVLAGMEIERQQARVAEGLTTALLGTMDLSDSLGALNESNIKLIEALEGAAALTIPTAAKGMDLSIQAEAVAKRVTAATLDAGSNLIGDVDAAKAALGLNTTALEDLNNTLKTINKLSGRVTPEEARAKAEAEMKKAQEEYYSQENILKEAENNFQGNIGSQASSIPGLTNDQVTELIKSKVDTGLVEELNRSPNTLTIDKIKDLTAGELRAIGEQNKGNNEILNLVLEELKKDKSNTVDYAGYGHAEFNAAISAINELIKTLDK